MLLYLFFYTNSHYGTQIGSYLYYNYVDRSETLYKKNRFNTVIYKNEHDNNTQNNIRGIIERNINTMAKFQDCRNRGPISGSQIFCGSNPKRSSSVKWQKIPEQF